MEAIEDDRVEDLPPAAKLTYLALRDHGPCLSRDLAETTALSQRTVRDALERLEDAGVVAHDHYLPDARARRYYLVDDEGGGG